ncbi:LOW QUALITY PROTEIN: hypothetical protein Cgig2_014970 [Carnegiea gigantea]|uniref:Endonuclease/exonuclease/phosphatase domain-containing protein n=1 Tax=Carnegiea gigantea TaxID=171969 RepID=A0A9Q1JWT1_9CARY|nr:LOW QUALITY PROTEIN: hypothetical protein Cgig2_014970 [Carnegiea gigantea]
MESGCKPKLGEGDRGEQQNRQAEFVTPRRTANRSPPRMREGREPTSNSFQALLENEIMDMVAHENGEDISLVLKKHNAALVGLMETKVKPHNTEKVARAFHGWHSYSNAKPEGKDRIWVIWKPNRYLAHFEKTTEQVIHCAITQVSTQKRFHITFVYGFNKLEQRRPMWQTLEEISQQVTGGWMVIGNFNAILQGQDRLGGDEVHDNEVRDFENALSNLTEVRSFGSYYSWSNKGRNGKRIWSRIDRAFTNIE